MRKLFFLSLMFLSVKCFAYSPSQSEVRVLFHEAATKESSCKKLVSILQPFDETNNALYAGYKATATMMMAKYVFNPFTKLSNFYKGKSLLEKSISNDKNNLELRFLRFSIQTNIPSFLGYKSSIGYDKAMLVNNFKAIRDQQLKQLIFALLINSDNLTATEKKLLKA